MTPAWVYLFWFTLIAPSLVLNYFDHGAPLLVNPAAINSLFYNWRPLLVIAPLATGIASQAVISGVFSKTWQTGHCARRISLRSRPRMIKVGAGRALKKKAPQ